MENTDQIKISIEFVVYNAEKKKTRVEYIIKLISQAVDVSGLTEQELVRKLVAHYDFDIKFVVPLQEIETKSEFLKLLACEDGGLKRD